MTILANLFVMDGTITRGALGAIKLVIVVTFALRTAGYVRANILASIMTKHSTGKPNVWEELKLVVENRKWLAQLPER
jgi:hypothetical protein